MIVNFKDMFFDERKKFLLWDENNLDNFDSLLFHTSFSFKIHLSTPFKA